MNIKQAAEHLNISVKTLERKIAAGDVSVAYVPGATGKQRTFDAAELDRFKASESEKAAATTYVISRSRNSDAPSSNALQRAGDGQGMAMVLSMLMEAQSAPQVPSMLLSVKEAAEFSGLSVSRIMKEIHAGTLDGRKIGRGFKLRPEDVRECVQRVFNKAEKYRKPDKAERVKVGGRKVKGSAR